MQNVDFFDFFRISLFRSKNQSFLSRILKNVSFWRFLLKKNISEKGRFFDKNHGLTPFQNAAFLEFFGTFLLCSKKHSVLSKITKNVFFWLSWLNKKDMKKSSICWEKPWTNPFAKCRFFSTLWELHFWGPKNFFFYPEYQKMFLYGFLLKKKHIRKRSIFWQKPWTNPFAKCQYFLTLLELHFSGLKSIVFYPEYQKMFLFGFLCSKEQIRKRSIFSEKPWTNPFAKCRFFRLF